MLARIKAAQQTGGATGEDIEGLQKIRDAAMHPNDHDPASSHPNTSEDGGSVLSAAEWRAAMRSIFASALETCEHLEQRRLMADVEEQIIQRVEQMRSNDQKQHAAAMRRLKTSTQWQMAAAEKKLANMRSASSTESKHTAVLLETRQKEALRSLEAEILTLRIGTQVMGGELAESEELTFQYARKVAELARIEQQLLHRVTLLDGGRMKAELEQQKYAQHVAETAARRLLNAKLAKGWHRWREVCDGARRMQNAVRRMLNAGLSRAMAQWAGVCAELTQSRRLLAAAATRLRKPALAASLSHWRSSWEQSLVSTERTELLGQIAALKDELEGARSLLSSTYGAEKLEEGRLLREQLMAAMGDAQQREATAREKWIEAERREAEARQAMIERLHGKAIRRMLSVRLAKGFSAWLDMWEARLEQRRLLASTIARLRRPRVIATYLSWKGSWQGELARKVREANEERERLRREAAREEEEEEAAERRRREAEEAARLKAEAEEDERRRAAAVAVREALPPKPGGDDDDDDDDYYDYYDDETTSDPAGSRPGSGRRRRPSSAEVVALRGEAARLRDELQASDESVRIARQESEFLASMVSRQQSELESLRRAASSAEEERLAMVRGEEALRAQLESTRAECEAHIVHCGKQLLACQEELAEARAETARGGADLEALKAQLRAAGQPLAQKERKVLVKSLQVQMEQMSEAVASNHLTRIRELAQLVALRDRQLSRSLASPRPVAQSPLRPSAVAMSPGLAAQRPLASAQAARLAEPLRWGLCRGGQPRRCNGLAGTPTT